MKELRNMVFRKITLRHVLYTKGGKKICIKLIKKILKYILQPVRPRNIEVSEHTAVLELVESQDSIQNTA